MPNIAFLNVVERLRRGRDADLTDEEIVSVMRVLSCDVGGLPSRGHESRGQKRALSDAEMLSVARPCDCDADADGGVCGYHPQWRGSSDDDGVCEDACPCPCRDDALCCGQPPSA